MATAKGVIFGQRFLDKQQFIQAFLIWYQQIGQEFVQALQTQIIEPINSGKNIETLYANWDNIVNQFFGNNSVDLMAVSKLTTEQDYSLHRIVPESQMIKGSALQLKHTGKTALVQLRRSQKLIEAAQEFERAFNQHMNDFQQQLISSKLDNEEASHLHAVLYYTSNLGRSKSKNEHFSGRNYMDILFSGGMDSSFSRGRIIEAFIAHLANEHLEVFQVLSQARISQAGLKNATNSLQTNSLSNQFANYRALQPWLANVATSFTSWKNSGDIVVVDDTGYVVYNIQTKSSNTVKGESHFGRKTATLQRFANKILQAVQNLASPQKLAELMYQCLETETTNDISNFVDNITDKQAEQLIKDAVATALSKNIIIKT